MPSYVPKHGSSHGPKGVDPVPFRVPESGTNDIFSPFVSSGLTASVTGADANVIISPGTAYNTQRLHTTTNTILTVTNTGVAHTEYVSVNTSGALIITTTARAADELAIADVSVDAAGMATAVTDVRQLKLHLKTAGVERLAVDEAGRVGIGTTSPSELLHVVGTVLLADSLRVYKDTVLSYTGFHPNTAGGADNWSVTFGGGGAGTSARGAYALARGNEYTAVAGQRGLVAFVAGTPNTPLSGRDGYVSFLAGGAFRMEITPGGNVLINTTTGNNILTIQQTSATDPIADAWTVYSLREGKTILKDAGVLDFDKTPVRRWKRKLVKPKLTDFEEIREKMKEGSIRTREDQLADALEEYNKKKGSQKFNQEQFGLIAEEAPDHLKAYDDTGELVGINTSAYVGWLHAVVKEQDTTIKDLTIRVQALEQALTRNRSI